MDFRRITNAIKYSISIYKVFFSGVPAEKYDMINIFAVEQN
jgi:hypothetical protein